MTLRFYFIYSILYLCVRYRYINMYGFGLIGTILAMASMKRIFRITVVVWNEGDGSGEVQTT